VLGIARYGRRPAHDMSPGGDFDLFVLVKECPEDVESLHFYLGGVPVDLNIRTIEHLRRSEPITEFDVVLTNAEILYDETGALQKELPALEKRWGQGPAELTDHDAQFNRFCQRHVLDKVRGRIEKEPLLCHFLLATNIYWLVQTYFRIRSLPFRGETDALKWLEANEPEIFRGIEQFYAAGALEEKLEITERLIELVLAPVGGSWGRGELVVLGTHSRAEGLDKKGRKLWQELFGAPFRDGPVEAEEPGR